jgi:hypothetical protein
MPMSFLEFMQQFRCGSDEAGVSFASVRTHCHERVGAVSDDKPLFICYGITMLRDLPDRSIVLVAVIISEVSPTI